eukprot:g9798.t1
MRQVREQLLDCWQRSSCLQETVDVAFLDEFTRAFWHHLNLCLPRLPCRWWRRFVGTLPKYIKNLRAFQALCRQCRWLLLYREVLEHCDQGFEPLRGVVTSEEHQKLPGLPTRRFCLLHASFSVKLLSLM